VASWFHVGLNAEPVAVSECGDAERQIETDLAPSERLFVQVGLRVRIRLPPAKSQQRTEGAVAVI
jgi:hypothetical protein